MRGNATLTGLVRTDLTDAKAAEWLAQLARDVPSPEGDHGTLVFAIHVEWDHVRPAP